MALQSLSQSAEQAKGKSASGSLEDNDMRNLFPSSMAEIPRTQRGLEGVFAVRMAESACGTLVSQGRLVAVRRKQDGHRQMPFSGIHA